MSVRTATLAALVTTLVLGASAAPAAQAAPTAGPAPLTVASVDFHASIDRPPAGQPVVCDGNNFVFCGFVSLEVELAGFDSRQPPGPDDYTWPLDATGTVDVTRVYGCASARGRRLYRYDTTVVQRDYALNARRGMPYPVPTEDSQEFGVYALLTDAQPGNCPKGTKPRLYRLTAQNAEFTLQSQWAGIPASHTYAIPGRAYAFGAAPTPAP